MNRMVHSNATLASRSLRGAHASRVLVSASRRNELPEATIAESASVFPAATRQEVREGGDAFASTRDACAPRTLRAARRKHLLAFLFLLACALSPARATDPDTFSPVVSYQYLDSLSEPGTLTTITSPVVSYQYLDSLAEPGTSTTITSPVVSYQYYDWPGDENLTFTHSPHVSYYYNGAPQILTQPLAQVRKVGQTATFTVSALGSTALAYQWRINGVNLPGATSAGIAIDNLQPSDSGAYSVVVSNAYGFLASRDAKLDVYLSPITPIPTMPVSTPATIGLSTAQTTRPTQPTSAQLKWFNSSTGHFEEITQSFAPGMMTIVLTHGWNSSPAAWPTAMASALSAAYGNKARIFAWDWHGHADSAFYRPAQAAGFTPSEGTALAKALLSTLGSSYNLQIHFIGHSFGTLVNCTAADYLHGSRRPTDEPKPWTTAYSSGNTHMTLLDEAELVQAFQGMHVWMDDLVSDAQRFVGDTQGAAGTEQDASRVHQLHVKVIPDQAAYVDNYISEVGELHSTVANTMLWRSRAIPGIQDIPLIEQILGPGLHGYASEWYRQSILNPTASLIGHRRSFERDTIAPMSQASAYYLQSLNVADGPLVVTPVDAGIATALTANPLNRLFFYGEAQGYRAIAYPTYEAYLGMTAVGNKIEGIYLDGIQYAGNMAANFAETFSAPKGTPVYLGTAGSTPAYFLPPGQTLSDNTHASWRLQFSIQPGAPLAQQLKVPMLATAVTNSPSIAAANAVYTIIPIHVPNEAVGMSFEYKMTGAAADDFMTMGIGTANDYTMEAKYVDDGQWNGTPVIQASDFHDQDVQLVFALNGASGPPAGTLSVRNIQFYIPPRPKMELQVAGPQLTVSWPLSAVDWTLESTVDLANPNGWQPVGVAPVDADYFHTQTFDIAPTNKAFFRLRK